MNRPLDSRLLVHRLHPDAVLPQRMSEGAAGLDLAARFNLDETVCLLCPGKTAVLGTGLALVIPEGFEGQIRPRSGLAAKHGVTVLNAPGTIDADYRGEVKVILINHGDTTVQVFNGDRIAQLVIAPVLAPEVEEVEELPAAERGEDGFGSTGR